jgi:hypothetical protein
VCWTSAAGYTSVNGQAYSALGASHVPVTVVDGTSYRGEWLQLSFGGSSFSSSAGILAPASYSVVPQLSSGATGVPDGQPSTFVLAGSTTANGSSGWTVLDATYATTAYRPVNSAVIVTCPTTTAAARTPTTLRAVRLVVTGVSVSASPPASGVLSASVCALQLFAPPAQAVLALAPSGATLVAGCLGVGTAAPLQRLDVRGSAAVSGSLGLGGVQPGSTYLLQLSRDAAAKPSTSTWTVYSDRRLKEAIVPADLERCYAIVRSVPLSRYTWRDDVLSPLDVPDRSKLGWIAQDVATAFPKAVEAQQAYGFDDCLSLNADQMIAALYGTVQLLQRRLEALEGAATAP